MAEHLARIFGTEEDKVNCPFYYKIGACRHGDRCSRQHMRPNFSQTLVVPHMYMPPAPGPDGLPVHDEQHFEDFYEEAAEELCKFGNLEELHIVENLGDHMFGNVYCKYSREEEAAAAVKGLNGRYYAGRILVPEYSPVTDFREARCRQFDETNCGRGGYCNFMHMKKTSPHLRKVLRYFNRQNKAGGAPTSSRRERSRSRSRGKDRDRRRSRSRSRSRERRRDRDGKDRSGRDRDSVPEVRSDSAERRAMIAQWNAEQDKAKSGGAP